ncbi:MAG: DNA repair protein RecO [Candidatus Omnitrophica bacterium]|nr:DNA repair protein RecO [Candidatus Omnitrophota bacterium]
MILKTEGIVLKTFDLRETSRIAVFFTKEYGKVKGVMKGIRKDRRKFGSHVDKFSVNDIVYYQYRRSDLHLISQCDLKQFFFPVREDYRRTLAAHYALELVDTIVPAEEPNVKIYQLLLDYLKGLESFPDIDRLVHIFQIKILLFSGFRPHIDACVKCRKKVEGKAYFSLKAGGLVCGRCPTREARESNLTPIARGTVATMLHIEASPWEKSLRLGLTKTVRGDLKYILNKFLVYHLERRIRTAAYL